MVNFDFYQRQQSCRRGRFDVRSVYEILKAEATNSAVRCPQAVHAAHTMPTKPTTFSHLARRHAHTSVWRARRAPCVPEFLPHISYNQLMPVQHTHLELQLDFSASCNRRDCQRHAISCVCEKAKKSPRRDFRKFPRATKITKK